MDEIRSLLFSCHTLVCWTPGFSGHCNITNVANLLLLLMSKSSIFKIFPNITSTQGWWDRHFELFLSWYLILCGTAMQCLPTAQTQLQGHIQSHHTILFTLFSTSEENWCNHKSHITQQCYTPLWHDWRAGFGLLFFLFSLLLSVMGSLL